MALPRRVGTETSKTRDLLLDCIERLMVDQGYAAVTYRAAATKAGVTPALVEYYFPNLDDLFSAVIRRRAEQNVERLTEALRARPDEPLRVVWEYSRDEVNAALTTEFLALGNHRKSIQATIAEVTKQVRRLQLNALQAKFGKKAIGDTGMSPSALLFVVTGIPKLISLEEGVGVATAHKEAVQAFEHYLESVEPRAGTSRRPAPRRRSKQ